MKKIRDKNVTRRTKVSATALGREIRGDARGVTRVGRSAGIASCCSAGRAGVRIAAVRRGGPRRPPHAPLVGDVLALVGVRADALEPRGVVRARDARRPRPRARARARARARVHPHVFDPGARGGRRHGSGAYAALVPLLRAWLSSVANAWYPCSLRSPAW